MKYLFLLFIPFLAFGQGRLVNPSLLPKDTIGVVKRLDTTWIATQSYVSTHSGGSADTSGMVKRLDTSWVATKSYVLSNSGASVDTSGMLKRVDTSWIARKSWTLGQFAPLATYLVPSDTSLHLKRTDTTWVVYRSRADNSYQSKGTYLIPADTNLAMKRTDTSWVVYRSRADNSYQTKATYLVPADTNLNVKRTDTTWIAYKNWLPGQYQARGTYLVPADTNLNMKRTDTTWIVYRSRADASYQAKGTYLVPADTNLHMKRTDTTWISYKSQADAKYLGKPIGTGADNYVPKWSTSVGGPVWRPDSTAAGGSGVWGSITGTLSSQTDLNTALGAKLDSSRAPSMDTTNISKDSTNYVLAPSGGKIVVSAASGLLAKVVKNADTTGMMKRVDTSWVATEWYVDNAKKHPSTFKRSNSDTWYGPDHGGMTTAPTTQACVASTVRAFPFYVGTSYTIDSVKFEVSTGVSGNIALAIYEDSDGDLYPDNRVLDLGAYSVTSTAVKADTLTAPLGASTSNGTFTFTANKLYFIGVHSNTTATLRAVAQTAMPHLLGWNPAIGANSQYTAWNRTSVTYTYPNSAPNPYGASGAFLANVACPLLVWRVKP